MSKSSPVELDISTLKIHASCSEYDQTYQLWKPLQYSLVTVQIDQENHKLVTKPIDLTQGFSCILNSNVNFVHELKYFQIHNSETPLCGFLVSDDKQSGEFLKVLSKCIKKSEDNTVSTVDVPENDSSVIRTNLKKNATKTKKRGITVTEGSKKKESKKKESTPTSRVSLDVEINTKNDPKEFNFNVKTRLSSSHPSDLHMKSDGSTSDRPRSAEISESKPLADDESTSVKKEETDKKISSSGSGDLTAETLQKLTSNLSLPSLPENLVDDDNNNNTSTKNKIQGTTSSSDSSSTRRTSSLSHDSEETSFDEDGKHSKKLSENVKKIIQELKQNEIKLQGSPALPRKFTNCNLPGTFLSSRLARLYSLESLYRAEGCISRLLLLPNRAQRLSKLNTAELLDDYKLQDIFSNPTLYFHFENFVKETHCEWAFYFIVENELFKTSVYESDEKMKWFAEEIGKRWFGPHSPIFDEDLTFYFNQVKKKLAEGNITLDMFDMIAESDIRPIMETKFVEFHDWYLNLELQRREMMLSTQRAMQKHHKLKLKLKLFTPKGQKQKKRDERYYRLSSNHSLLSDFLEYLRDRNALQYWFLNEEIKEFQESDFDSKDAIRINAMRIAAKYLLRTASSKNYVSFPEKSLYDNLKEALKLNREKITVAVFDPVVQALDFHLRKMFGEFWKTRSKLFKTYGVDEEEEEEKSINAAEESPSFKSRAKIQASFEKLSATFSISNGQKNELDPELIFRIQDHFGDWHKNKQLTSRFEDYLIERNSIQWLSLAEDISDLKLIDKRYQNVISVSAISLSNKYLLNAPTSVFKVSIVNSELIEDLRKHLKESPIPTYLFDDIEQEVYTELRDLYSDFCWYIKSECAAAKKFEASYSRSNKEMYEQFTHNSDLLSILSFCLDVEELQAMKNKTQIIATTKSICSLYFGTIKRCKLVKSPCNLVHVVDPVLLCQVHFRIKEGQHSNTMYNLIYYDLRRHLISAFVDVCLKQSSSTSISSSSSAFTSNVS
eukprot:TRINITY_DN6605_c0_g1_i4.p1 TRINITY_DN6605_c0_g1~~TRINITY_DN6605_c0_g1_i4.p1  ORF type:complete len:1008 (+),score=208.30 TRINITY_DN6605_c0_g1_i4:200-3223(+)